MILNGSLDVNVEAAPAGATVYRTDEGAGKPVFYKKNENGIRYDLDPSEWSKREVVSYDRDKQSGYNRQEIAFYTRQLQVNTQEISSGTAQVYGEIVDITQQLDDGYDSRSCGMGWIKSRFYNRIGQPMMVVSNLDRHSNYRYRKWTLIESDLDLGTFHNSVTRAYSNTFGGGHGYSLIMAISLI